MVDNFKEPLYSCLFPRFTLFCWIYEKPVENYLYSDKIVIQLGAKFFNQSLFFLCFHIRFKIDSVDRKYNCHKLQDATFQK